MNENDTKVLSSSVIIVGQLRSFLPSFAVGGSVRCVLYANMCWRTIIFRLPLICVRSVFPSAPLWRPIPRDLISARLLHDDQIDLERRALLLPPAVSLSIDLSSRIKCIKIHVVATGRKEEDTDIANRHPHFKKKKKKLSITDDLINN